MQTWLEETGLKSAIPLVRMSDGTVRWLVLLSILLHPEPPRLVCIEEPELGLHPDMIHELGKLLIAASQRMQLIVTTHSDALIEEFSEMPEAVLVCEKEAGSSTLERLDKKQLSSWLKKYSLGQLWRKGQIGETAGEGSCVCASAGHQDRTRTECRQGFVGSSRRCSGDSPRSRISACGGPPRGV